LRRLCWLGRSRLGFQFSTHCRQISLYATPCLVLNERLHERCTSYSLRVPAAKPPNAREMKTRFVLACCIVPQESFNREHRTVLIEGARCHQFGDKGIVKGKVSPRKEF